MGYNGSMTNQITVEATINAPVEKVWEYWTKPEHITKWAFASDDWHAPSAENDVRAGGKFKTRMESRDGSEGFNFAGEYTTVEEYRAIEYTMDDGRQVSTSFSTEEDGCKVVQTFDPESENPIEVQKEGWQSILNSFKKYVESN